MVDNKTSDNEHKARIIDALEESQPGHVPQETINWFADRAEKAEKYERIAEITNGWMNDAYSIFKAMQDVVKITRPEEKGRS